jgi:hypothetical protein
VLFMGFLTRLLPKGRTLTAIALNVCFGIGRNVAYCRECFWTVRVVDEVEQQVDAYVNENWMKLQERLR